MAASTPLDMEKEIVFDREETTPFLLQKEQPQRLQRISGRQSSFVTVLALWNTMIATSVLSLPWAVKEAGLLCGVPCLIAVAVIMGYTSHLVLHSVDRIAEGQRLEFHDVCQRYLGRWSKVLAVTGSLLSLVGGMIIYWLLISNFLFHIGNFVYSQWMSLLEGVGGMIIYWLLITNFRFHIGNFFYNRVNDINGSEFNSSSEQYGYAVCDGESGDEVKGVEGEGFGINSSISSSSSSGGNSSSGDSFHQWWSQTNTIPLFLLVVLFPLLHFKRATVFTVMNSVGMLSLLYLVVFVAVKAADWGLNLEPQTPSPDRDLYKARHAPLFRWSFPALTGVASLGYFVQNSVLSLVRNQRQPRHNTRDLILAYAMVAVTYIYVGGTFYLTFPLNKNCIADNLLDNVASDDVLGLVARAGLCFQLTCVFPQLAYITRIQLFTAFFSSPWPSVVHVIVLNTVIVTICVLFAVFLPHIGRILSFVGALSGFYYAIGLPCLVRCVILKQEGRLTCFHVVLHVLLPLLGLVNFLAQFFVVD